jgi:hypothetical protein
MTKNAWKKSHTVNAGKKHYVGTISFPQKPGGNQIVVETRKLRVRQRGGRDEMYGAVLTNLRVWLKGLDAETREKPIVATASGESVTPKSLVQNVENATPLGRKYVKTFSKLALKNVMQKSLSGWKGGA